MKLLKSIINLIKRKLKFLSYKAQKVNKIYYSYFKI